MLEQFVENLFSIKLDTCKIIIYIYRVINQKHKHIKIMKTYTLRLKGTKKNNTPDMEVKIFGDNKSQAFNYAYRFFELGEFISPYFANGLGIEVPGTAGYIEGVSKMMHLAGKYKVSIYSIK